METIIKIDDVWGKERQDRKGVVVEIKNRDQTFKWMPTYKELSKIYLLLAEVEVLNQEKATNPLKMNVNKEVKGSHNH